MKRIFGLMLLILTASWATAKTHALLIGVQSYKNPKWRLAGPKNDVALFKDYLQRNYRDLEITVLFDEQATHGGIIAALEKLQTVAANDTVIIYYSGHGSGTRDLNGDEESDKYDETWVTFGARTGIADLDDYDLLDDELNYYLDQIPTSKQILISDSCQSGSMGREVNEKSLANDVRAHPLANRFQVNKQFKGIRLAATGDQLKAYEQSRSLPDGSRVTYSCYTWSLVKALSEAQVGASWRDIHQSAKAILKETFKEISQEPQIEGNGQIRLDFSGPSARTRSAVVEGREDDLWILDRGQAHGVSEGSLFEAKRQKGITRLKVVETGLYQSAALLTVGPLPEVGLLVDQKNFRLQNRRVRVVFAYDTQWPEDLRWLDLHVKQPFQEELEWVTHPKDADWVVWLIRADQSYEDPFKLPTTTPGGERQVWLANSQGRPLFTQPIHRCSSAPNPLIKRLRRCMKRESLFQLSDDEPGDGFVFTPIFIQKGEPEVPNGVRMVKQGQVYGQWQPKGTILPKGTVFAYRIKNMTGGARYFYVLVFGPEGGIQVAFPNGFYQEDYARFEPGEEKYLEKGARVFNTTGWEHIRVIGSERPLDVSFFSMEEWGRDEDDAWADDHAFSTRLYSYKIIQK